jgi:hypothetical protein
MHLNNVLIRLQAELIRHVFVRSTSTEEPLSRRADRQGHAAATIQAILMHN